MSEEIAAIGIRLDTDGVERGVKALDTLAGQGAKVEAAMGKIEQATAKTGKTLDTLGAGSGKNLDALGKSGATAADGMGKLDKASGAAAASAAQIGSAVKAAADAAFAEAAALKKAADAAAGFRAAHEAAASETDKFIRALERQTATFGKSATEMARYDASLLGVSKTQQAHIEQLLKTAAAQEKTAGSAKSAGAGLMDSARGFLTAAAAAVSLNKAIQTADAWTNMNNRIKLVTQSQTEFAQAQSNIISIANATRQPLAETAELYQRVAMNQKQLGMTGNEMAGVIKTISQTMVISGTSAQGAQAALVQLGQAFASGTLRGEELNSVLEQAPALAQAISAGMGKTVGELRALGAEGKLTAESVVGALQKQAGAVDKNFNTMTATVSQSMTVAGNKLTEFIGKLDKSTGASGLLAGAIVGVSNNMGAFATGAATLVGVGLAVWLTGAATAAGGLTAAIGLATGAATAFMASIGPLGWAVLAVGAVATAWQLMGNKAQVAGVQTDDAASKARAAGDKLVAGLGTALSAISKGYDELIAKQKQALGLAPSSAQALADQLKGSDAKMTGLGKRISQANNGEGDYSGMAPDARRAATAAMLDEMKGFATARAAIDKQIATSNTLAVDEYTRNADRMTDAGRKELKQQKAGMEYAEAYRRANGDIAKELAVRKSYERELANIGEEFAKKDAKGSGGGAAVRAANKELDSQAKLLSELSGLTGTFSKDWARLNTQFAAGKLSVEQLTQAQAVLLAKQPAMKAAAAERAKAEKEFGDAAMREHNAELKRVESIEKTLSGMTDQNQKLKEEIEMLGLSEQAQLAITQARLSSVIAIKEEQVARLQNTEFMSREQIALEEEIRLLKERMGLLGQKTERNVAVEKAKEAAGEWKKLGDDIERGLTDSLFRAFESGKGFFRTLWDGIKNLFKTTALKLLIQPITNGASSALGLGGGGAGSGAGGIISNASSINTIYGLGSQALTGSAVGASAASLGYANTVGALGGDAIGALIASNGGYAGVAAAGGTAAGGAAATGTFLGMGPAGWIALAALAAFTVLSQKGDSRFGSQGSYTPGGGTSSNGGPNGAADDFGGVSSANKIAAMGIDKLLETVGSKDRLAYLAGGFESSEKGKGFSYAGGILSNGKAFGQGTDGLGYQNNRGSMSPEQAQASYITELKQATLQALQSATDIPKSIADQLKGVNIDALTGQALDGLMASVNQVIVDVDSLRGAVKSLPFANLKDLSFDAAAGLIAAAGGLQALSDNLATYYTNFYSAEEQRAQTVKNIASTINAAGGAITESQVAGASREQARQYAESVDVSTEAGQKLYAALMGVAGAFAGITEAAVDSKKALLDSVASARAALDKAMEGETQTKLRAYQDQASALQSTVTQFRSFAEQLKKFRDGLLLGSLSPLTPEQRYVEAQKQFNAAKASGDAGQLQSASSALLEASQVYNASNATYISDFAKVQEALSAASVSASASADVAQLQLDAIKSQLSVLETVNNSVLSVADAIAGLTAAVLAAVNAGANPGLDNINALTGGKTNQQVGSAYMSSGGAGGVLGANGWQVYTPGGASFTQAQAQAFANERLAANDPMSIYNAAKANGLSMPAVNDLMGWAPGTSEQWARENGLPTFASGGMHAGGWAMVGERGPELAYMPPARIYNAGDTSRMTDGRGNAELVAEIRALREEVKQLRADQNQQTGALIQSTYDASNKNADAITQGKSRERWSKNEIALA